MMLRWLVCALVTVSVLAQDAAPVSGANFDEIERQVQRLGDADFAVREAASKALLAAGKDAGAALKKATANSDAEIEQRARALLAQIYPALELAVERADASKPVKVGQPVVLQVRIKNVSEITVAAVRSLDGSSNARRYPHFTREDSGDIGAIPGQGKMFCKYCNQLHEDDFVTLKPGESFDPFGTFGHGQSGFGAEHCEYTPTKPGKVTLTFACDYSATDPLQWDGPGQRSEQQLTATEKELFRMVPKIRMRAKVELEVKE